MLSLFYSGSPTVSTNSRFFFHNFHLLSSFSHCRSTYRRTWILKNDERRKQVDLQEQVTAFHCVIAPSVYILHNQRLRPGSIKWCAIQNVIENQECFHGLPTGPPNKDHFNTELHFESPAKWCVFRVNCTSSVRIFTVSSSSSSLDEVQIVRASIYRLLKNEKLQNSDLKLRCTSWSKNFYPDWLWRNHFPSKLLWRFARAMREVVILAGRQCVCVWFSITASSWRTTIFNIPHSMFAWCHVTYQYCKTWESQIIESGWSL